MLLDQAHWNKNRNQNQHQRMPPFTSSRHPVSRPSEKHSYIPLTPSPLNPNTRVESARQQDRTATGTPHRGQLPGANPEPGNLLAARRPGHIRGARSQVAEPSPTERLLRKKAAAAWRSAMLRHHLLAIPPPHQQQQSHACCAVHCTANSSSSSSSGGKDSHGDRGGESKRDEDWSADLTVGVPFLDGGDEDKNKPSDSAQGPRSGKAKCAIGSGAVGPGDDGIFSVDFGTDLPELSVEADTALLHEQQQRQEQQRFLLELHADVTARRVFAVVGLVVALGLVHGLVTAFCGGR